MGAVLTFAGFSMYNFKFRYFFFPAVGILLTALFFYQDIATTNHIVILLFGSTLAPMTRKYGLLTGILSGMIFSVITRNANQLTAGINLYNCGFSGGVTVLLMDAVRLLFYKNQKIKFLCQNHYLRLIQKEKKLIAKFQITAQRLFLKIFKTRNGYS